MIINPDNFFDASNAKEALPNAYLKVRRKIVLT